MKRTHVLKGLISQPNLLVFTNSQPLIVVSRAIYLIFPFSHVVFDELLGIGRLGQPSRSISSNSPNVGFVDAEGQGDKDVSYDANLICPILLASKVVIFNWKGRSPVISLFLLKLISITILSK